MPGTSQRPIAQLLPDGRRLHLNHGPIDLVIEAFGPARELAHERATARFQTILDELVGELTELREPCKFGRQFNGVTARRMQRAVEYFLPQFITPMAAVAGAVADEILDAMVMDEGIEKIYVNNGGDSAFHLSEDQSINAMIAAPFPATILVHATDNIRGIATSGWRGRSQSLGIADSVSVVAKNCAFADAAATMIANEVNLKDDLVISRTPARELVPDSDLGDALVTTGVGELTDWEISRALNSGEQLANTCLKDDIIGGAMLVLNDQTRQIGAKNLIRKEPGETVNA